MLKWGIPLMVLLAACSNATGQGAKAGEDAKAPVGTPCGVDADCESDECLSDFLSADSVCTTSCAEAPCPPGPDGVPMACAMTAAGPRCALACRPDETFGYACIGGVPTLCEYAPDTECATCGCPADATCDPGVGCQPKRQVMEACATDAECLSNNCGRPRDAVEDTTVCLQSLGAPCTWENCQVCSVYDQPYCSRVCTSHADCPGSWHCRGHYDGDGAFSGTCMPDCRQGWTCPTTENWHCAWDNAGDNDYWFCCNAIVC